MRLLVESELKPGGGIVGAGFDEFRWPHPVASRRSVACRERGDRHAPIQLAPRAGSDQGSDDYVGKAVQVLVSNLVVRRRGPGGNKGAPQ
jgi:hypothetical protein